MRPLSPASATDAITLEERRFDSVKRVLPAHGVIGYLSDINPQGEGEADYYVTEYSLAPLQVSQRPDHDIVVGNFRNVVAATAAIQQNRLRVAQDFGGGVLLLRHETQ